MIDWLATLESARVAPNEPGRSSALLMRHGTMSLRYYAPRGTDPQTPHDQDELYIIAVGFGHFVQGSDEAHLDRRPFVPGDVIFVPAGRLHRFVDFSNDFGTWVVFWGPPGGER